MVKSIMFYVTLVPLLYLVLSFAALLVSYVFNSLRYCIFVRFFGHVLDWKKSFIILSGVMFVSSFFPKGGMVLAKPYLTHYTTRNGLKGAFFATVFEQLFETAWQVVALPLMLFFFSEKVIIKSAVTTAEVVFLLFSLMLILFLLRKRIFRFIFAHKDKIPHFLKKRLAKYNFTKENMLKFSQQMREFIKDYKRNFLIVCLTALIFFSNPLAFYLLFLGAQIHVTFFEIIIVYWVSLIIGKISGIPGGFAARDLTSIGMLVSLGVASDLAISMSILFRLLTLVVPTVIGGPVLLVFLKKIVRKHKSG
ncbi:flippase-like domain-containing protein [Candidatus Woesearchaeota archaeon]|nr:flippase-like domain-containing protein [Candidatus Woesearchaeota archaeon]